FGGTAEALPLEIFEDIIRTVKVAPIEAPSLPEDEQQVADDNTARSDQLPGLPFASPGSENESGNNGNNDGSPAGKGSDGADAGVSEATSEAKSAEKDVDSTTTANNGASK